MADDTLTAELAKAQKIADGLGFACRLPDKKPDFFACGGPAAEAYWDYFTPARISSLLAAIEAVLKCHVQVEKLTRLGPPAFRKCADCDQLWPCSTVRDITAALTGAQPGEDENHD